MEFTCQLIRPFALNSRKKFLIPTGWEAGLRTGLGCGGEEKNICQEFIPTWLLSPY